MNNKTNVKQQTQKKNKKGLVVGLTTLLGAAIIASTGVGIYYMLKSSDKPTTQDKEQVDAINTKLKSVPTTFPTMTHLLEYLTTQNIDLLNMKPEKNDSEYVWDQEKNVIILLKNDQLFYGPSDYTLNTKKPSLWKMVKSSTPINVGETEIFSSNFSSTTEYSQYLRDGYKYDVDGKINIISGLDMGNLVKKHIEFDRNVSLQDVKIIIRTNQTSLHIKNMSNSVDHYSNLTKLQIDSISNVKGTTYTEYGTVDSSAIISSSTGTVNFAAGCAVNNVVVACDQTTIDTKINVQEDSNVGTVAASVEVSKEKIETIVTKAEGTETKIITDTIIDNPSEKGRFYSGFGTAASPYAIANTQQLINMADEVSTKGSTEERHFILINDISLKDKTWTPVGTSANPFIGTFNGAGFIISDLTLNKTTESSGFFGYTNGTRTGFDTIEDGWNDETEKFNEDVLNEENFSTIIKNLTLNNIKISGQDETKKKFTGALASNAVNTLISGIHLTNSSIEGYKYVGGLCGIGEGCCFANCTTDSTTKIVAKKGYHAGGIAGGTQYTTTISQGEAFYKCVNNADIETYNETEATPGGCAGIVAFVQNTPIGCVIEGCVNNGNIHSKLSENVTAECSITSYAAGIVALSQHVYAISNCTNTKDITVDRCSLDLAPDKNNAAAGIATYGAPSLYNCSNEGKVSGYSYYLSGLLAKENSTMGSWEKKRVAYISNCSNKILPENERTPEQGGRVANYICGSAGYAEKEKIIANATFENVDALNQSIRSLADGTIFVYFKNVKVINPDGMINLTDSISSIICDNDDGSKICSNVKIPSNNNITIDIPKVDIMVGDDCSKTTLTNCGDNSTLTVTQTGSLNNVVMKGKDSSFVNYGLIQGLSLSASATEATNQGSMRSLWIDDTTSGKHEGISEKHFVNKGTLLTTTGHSVLGQSGACITIDNYGTIEHQSTGSSEYVLCLYTNKHNQSIINSYSGSLMKSDRTGSLFSYTGFDDQASLIFNCHSGSQLYYNGEYKGWTTIKDDKGHIVVNEDA